MDLNDAFGYASLIAVLVFFGLWGFFYYSFRNIWAIAFGWIPAGIAGIVIMVVLALLAGQLFDSSF